jgi:hypothetical protein
MITIALAGGPAQGSPRLVLLCACVQLVFVDRYDSMLIFCAGLEEAINAGLGIP